MKGIIVVLMMIFVSLFSEEDGSDTDVICDYFSRVRNGEIQHDSDKRKKKFVERAKDKHYRKNWNSMVLNASDYTFVSDIKHCGANGESRFQTNLSHGQRVDRDMRFLYGDSGSQRISDMEKAVETIFMQMQTRINFQKQKKTWQFPK